MSRPPPSAARWLLTGILAVCAPSTLSRAGAAEPAPKTNAAPPSATTGLDRGRFWHRDFSSAAAYDLSVQTNREDLRRMLGAVDPRVKPGGFDAAATTVAAKAGGLVWEWTRWPVFPGVHAEGIHLRPEWTPAARVVVVPDADQTPEMLAGLAPGLPPERQIVRRLAEQGCEVLCLAILDRQAPKPAAPGTGPEAPGGTVPPPSQTGASRRDQIALQAWPWGRHVLGYEVEEVFAAIDALNSLTNRAGTNACKTGLVGYGEGGWIALFAAALDPRVAATLASGCFGPAVTGSGVLPCRTLFGFSREFAPAEVASLVTPRALVIEFSTPPDAGGEDPDYQPVEDEFDRARALLRRGDDAGWVSLRLTSGNEGRPTVPGSDRALVDLLYDLGLKLERLKPVAQDPPAVALPAHLAGRQERLFEQFQAFTRSLAAQSQPNP